MLHVAHFRDHIRGFDQLFFRIPPCQNNVGHEWLFSLQELDDFINVQIVIAQRDIDLVQQHEINLWVQNHFLGLFPSRTRRCNVTFAVLGFPCEAFTRDNKFALIRKAFR